MAAPAQAAQKVQAAQTVQPAQTVRAAEGAHYHGVARTLHWVIAALVILNILIGLSHETLGNLIHGLIPVHKSIGLSVLALTVVRIGWRATHRPPRLPAGMPVSERAAAHLAHAALYLLMLLLPLSGWIFTSAGQYPLRWFGLFDIPKFAVAKGDAIVGLSHEGHELMGYAMAALVAVHAAAALRHHFILKDGLLRRMLRGPAAGS